MNDTQVQRRPKTDRRGTTCVETAFVLPVFLMFVLVLVESGHAQMIKNMLVSACREAARLGTTEGVTSSEVQARVRAILGGAIDPSHVVVVVKDAGAFDSGSNPPDSASELAALPNLEITDSEQGDLFLVRATVDYDDVAVIPLSIPIIGNYLDDITLAGQAFARHE